MFLSNRKHFLLQYGKTEVSQQTPFSQAGFKSFMHMNDYVSAQTLAQKARRLREVNTMNTLLTKTFELAIPIVGAPSESWNCWFRISLHRCCIHYG